MAFVGQDTNGATLQMGTLDGKPGFSPMHLLLIAVAGCTGMDIVSILRKKHLASERYASTRARQTRQ